MIIKQKYIRGINRHFKHIEYGARIVFGFPITENEHPILMNMGFSNEMGDGETILPKPIFGNVSVYNAEGKYRIRRDLPKETAYRQVEWHWTEWRGRYDTEDMSDIRDVPYKRYPREFIPPPSVELTISKTDDDSILVISPSFKFRPENYDMFIHVVNLFLEIFNECHILNVDLIMMTLPRSIRINWTILPPGEYPWERLKEYVEPVLKQAKKGKRPVISHRLEVISSYNPKFVAVGRAGFTGYLIFGFPERNLFVCESAFYGNATYIFDENWENLSRLSKAEILSRRLQKGRIIHRKTWPNKIQDLLGSI